MEPNFEMHNFEAFYNSPPLSSRKFAFLTACPIPTEREITRWPRKAFFVFAILSANQQTAAVSHSVPIKCGGRGSEGRNWNFLIEFMGWPKSKRATPAAIGKKDEYLNKLDRLVLLGVVGGGCSRAACVWMSLAPTRFCCLICIGSSGWRCVSWLGFVAGRQTVN